MPESLREGPFNQEEFYKRITEQGKEAEELLRPLLLKKPCIPYALVLMEIAFEMMSEVKDDLQVVAFIDQQEELLKEFRNEFYGRLIARSQSNTDPGNENRGQTTVCAGDGGFHNGGGGS